MVKSTIEGYFSIQNSSNREKITFALLMDVAHVKYWWETYYEKSSTKDSGMFGPKPTWGSFFMLLRSNNSVLEAMMTSK